MNSGFLIGLTAALGLLVVILSLRLLRHPVSNAPTRLEIDLAGLQRDKRRAEEALEQMGEGVVVLDEGLRPVLANGAARRLLGLQRISLPYRLPSEEVLAVARLALEAEEGVEEVVGIWFPARRDLRVRAAPLEDGHGIVVVMQDATEELRTLKIRREFVSNASHELKSPIAGLQALAEAIHEASPDDPAAVRRFADRMSVEADRLGRLIADLLDLSRLEEAGRVPEEPTDLSAVAERTTQELQLDAHEKSIDLQRAIDRAVFVQGDADQLAAMIRNLLDNAVRYTAEGGWVRIEVSAGGADAIVRISDNGMGIPLDAQERIFERFYRVDRARSRDSGGTGLGLAIAKHVVELHSGRIELESELGTGSTFTVHLPAVAPREQQIRSVAG